MIGRFLPGNMALLLLSALCVLPAQYANAATDCTVSASGVSFGSYDAIGTNATTPLDGSGTITVTCGSANNTVSVAISAGSSNNFVPTRRMASGVNRLDYNLYTDATYSSVWGDGTGGSQIATIPVDHTKQGTRTVYGRIPSGLDPAVGSYSDTLTVTVNF